MKQIPLHGKYGKGKFALVDDEHYYYLSQFVWNVSDKGYARRSIGNSRNGTYKIIYMHRELFPSIGNRTQIDHVNNNKLDNQLSNLRICTNQENNMNKLKQRGSYSSQYKGVTYSNYGKRKKRWLAQIQLDGKHLFIGYFLTEVEADLAYNKKAGELFGSYACFNEVSDVI